MAIVAPVVCNEPGCPALTERASRKCDDHDRVSTRNHRGIPPLARGYDGAYRNQRRKLIGQPCELRLPGCLGLADSADHVVPVSQGGRGGPVRPACHHCNAAAGARLVRVG